MVARRIPDPKVGGSNPSGFRHSTAATKIYAGELGLVGYDDCLTRSRSRVRFSELVWHVVGAGPMV